ncbi:unnamed protein product [Clonostachys byssicola]|uniref:Heterokaryon incompatibility domain-containing protein n=1 Tax=Clonostachys byssicola TaxID=160290 RepID=A0A9N9UHG7_9HYPO|nr:unnamed protein product [Clonostachys byssicola]
MVDLAGKISVTSEQEPFSCHVCRSIVDSFKGLNDDDLEPTIGDIKSIRAVPCPYHAGLLKNELWRLGPVEESDSGILVLMRGRRSKTIFLTLHGEETQDSEDESGEDDEDGGSDAEESSDDDGDSDAYNSTDQLALVHRQDIPDHQGKARLLDPEWLDADTVRGWIETCERDHPNCRDSELWPGENSIRPKYLIDVIDSRLVLGDHAIGDYVALSYVWGQTKTLRTMANTLGQLSEPGAFGDGRLRKQMPKTVKDAMGIVGCLGLRYLWVDALCIVQDDSEQLRLELGRMPGIYASASFTLVAANGADASHGLPGFKGVSSPRSLHQKTVKLAGSETLVVTPPIPRSRGSASYRKLQIPYHQRAWTFQEYQFASRKLVFQGHTAFWRCSQAEWWEDHHQAPGMDAPEVQESEAILKIIAPMLSFLSSMIMEFNQKSLSFPEDAASAFTGLQNVLRNRVFPDGLLYGLPIFFFEMALLWRPRSDIYRRVPTKKQDSNEAIPKSLPSWSWLGWSGNVAFPDDCEFAAYNGGSTDEREGFVSPVTEWYTVPSPSSRYSDKQALVPGWYASKKEAQTGDGLVPEGWERQNFDEDQLEPGDREGLPRSTPRFSFEIESLAAASRQNNLFPRLLHWYPVPVASSRSGEATVRQSAYISCRTERAFLFGGSTIDGTDPPRLQLLDGKGVLAGYLQLHNEGELEQFQATETPGKRVELVSVAKGYTGRLSGDRTVLEKEEDRSLWFRDCLFVLWVEWDNGVAFRRGSGVVLLEGWNEACGKDFCDLVLG